MTDHICLVIPASVLEDELAQYLKEHMESYRSALDLTGDYYDRRSQVDRVEITRVEVDVAQVTIHYTVEYSGFRPCQDFRYSEVAMRQTRGQRRGNEIWFETFKNYDRRSTCDEL